MAIVAVALGPLLALTWQTGEEDRRRAAKTALNRSYAVVDRVASGQTDLIESSAVLMTGLAELSLFTRGERGRCERIVRRAFNTSRRAANIIAVGPSGRVFCSARPVSPRMRLRDVIAVGRGSRTGLQLGRYTVDPITRRPVMLTALPVRRADGSLQGTLVVPLDMRWLNRAAPSFGLPPEARVRVVDGDGRTLVGWPDPASAVGRAIPREAADQLRRRARGSFTATGSDDIERLVVFRRLPSADGTRVSAIVESPTDDVYAEAERVRRRNLVAIAVAVVGAILGAAVAARVLVLRPIRRLAETARRLGAGDLSARAGSGYGGELAELAAALDQSAAALERREQERGQSEADLRRLAEQRRLLIAETLAAEDRTRTQLSEALHDDALQVLLAARHELADAAKGDQEALLRTREYLDQASRRLRVLTNDLAPGLLAFTTLASGIENLARLQAELNGWDLRLELDAGVTSDHDRLLMRAARELLLNVAKHASAQSVSVGLREHGGYVELAVRDDGRGFEPDVALAVRSGHIGLASLSARTEAVGGEFDIESGEGRGSTVTVRIPSQAVG